MLFSPSTRAVVLTISDRCFRGEQTDISGPVVAKLLETAGARVTSQLLPDDQDLIVAALRGHLDTAELIVTTGGTGLAPRDVTPEATRLVCDRLIDGLAEMMRAEGCKHTRFAALSRAVCGSAGRTLIINLPGNPAGARSSLGAVLDLLPHALDLLAGRTTHVVDPSQGIYAPQPDEPVK